MKRKFINHNQGNECKERQAKDVGGESGENCQENGGQCKRG
jgi:hypothetical protein